MPHPSASQQVTRMIMRCFAGVLVLGAATDNAEQCLAQDTSIPAIASEIAVPQPPKWGEAQDLLQQDLKENWQQFSPADKQAQNGVWQRVTNSDPTQTELVCTGDPRGFLFTRQDYSEFELTFEWRFAEDPNGNSGILIFTQEDLRIWPTSIQVQLHQPLAGSVFPVGEAASDNTVKREGLARSVGEWNQCHILSRNGNVVVHVNGKKAGEVTSCKPAEGRIALQSEGSEVHFRRVLIRTPAEEPVAKETPAAKETTGENSLSAES